MDPERKDAILEGLRDVEAALVALGAVLDQADALIREEREASA